MIALGTFQITLGVPLHVLSVPEERLTEIDN
jgi:hypothetical protein